MANQLSDTRNANPPQLAVDLGSAIHALADALDLVGVDDLGHGKRVALMVHACAEVGGLSPESRQTLAYGALIHDCGVSSTRVHHHLVSELDWGGVRAHCETGAALVAGFPPLAALAPVLLHHHTHWQELVDSRLEEATREAANLVFLCDRLDALVATRGGPGQSEARRSALMRLGALGGRLFAPKLLDWLHEAASPNAFWERLRPEHVDGATTDLLAGFPAVRLESAMLFRLARIFSHIIDAKSPFTARHSLGVAALARHLGEQLGVPDERRDELELAGLLHDLGKLRVPDHILDKEGKLSDVEWPVMRRHAADTYRVLARVTGWKNVARWAGAHHEHLNGDGYPAGRHHAELPLETRILTVADVFQALAQARPYRAPLPVSAIVSLLKDEVAVGRLDRDVVRTVSEQPQQCWRAAVIAEPLEGGGSER